VYEVFGADVLLLHWTLGFKGEKKQWKNLTLAKTRTSTYQDKLARGNIGIALGEPSGGVCAIDLDTDEIRNRFLVENPWAQKTTEVRGARGSKFFVRIVGTIPGTHHLYEGDKDVAQWLSDGSQAIVSGKHPDGMWYRFINTASPFVLPYKEIKWPIDLNRSRQAGFTEHQSNGATEAIEQQSSTEQLDAVIYGVVDRFIPTTFHQNNPLMFQIARGLKDIADRMGRELTIAEFKTAFDRWKKQSRRFWRQELSEDDYWVEFLDACMRAQHGLEADPRLGAWEESANIDIPPEASQWVTDPRIRRLIALCIVLKRRCNNGPFFASTRWVAEQFDISHDLAARWLRFLRHLKILRIVKQGTSKHCPRYECAY
jgi:hypothetical protein